MLLPPVLYLTAAIALFHAAWGDPTRLSIGVGGDPWVFMWMLGWPAHALMHGQNPFLTNHIDFPTGVDLLWTNFPVLVDLLSTPLLSLAGYVLTFNVLTTLGLVLSAWAAYVAIERLVGNRVGALIGGLLYGFSPFMLGHSLGHLNLVLEWTSPLVLLLVHELTVRRRWHIVVTGEALGLVLAAQLYTSTEPLLSTCLVASIAICVATAICLVRRIDLAPIVPRVLGGGAIAGAVSLLLGAPLLITMFFGPHAVVGASIQPYDVYVTDLLSIVVPDSKFLLAPTPLVNLTLHFTGYPIEWNGYVGLPLLLLLVWIAWRWRRVLVIQWASCTAAIVLVLSLGPHLHVGGLITPIKLPWRLFDHLPIVEHMLPARLMLHFYLLAGVMVAYMIEKVFSVRPKRTDLRVAASVWLAFSFVALLPNMTWPATPSITPAFFENQEAQRIPAGSVALVAPYAVSAQPIAMLWQAAAGYRYKMPEGYAIHPNPGGAASFDPAPSQMAAALGAINNGGDVPAETSDLRRQLRCELAQWQVQTIIVGPMNGDQRAVRLITWIVDRPPERVGGVWVWRDISETCS